MPFTKEYRGYTIALLEEGGAVGSWTVKGPDVDTVTESYAAAKERVDKQIAKLARARRTSETVSWRALSKTGRAITLKGLHGGNGNLLTEEALAKGELDVIYAPAPFVVALIAEHKSLKSREAVILGELNRVAVRWYAHTRLEGPEQYDRRFAELKEKWEAAVNAAQARQVEVDKGKVL